MIENTTESMTRDTCMYGKPFSHLIRICRYLQLIRYM